MLMGIIPNLGFLKLEGSGFMRLVLSTNCAVRHLLYPQCHIDLYHQRNTQNAAGQSSRGSASKGQMQLTSYLWKKIGMLWKNYGKAMEFLFWGSVRTLHNTVKFKVACISFEVYPFEVYTNFFFEYFKEACISFEVYPFEVYTNFFFEYF